MPNPENIIPTQFKSGKKARESGRKGGKKSGEAKREKKRLRELLELALATKDSDGNTAAESIVAALVREAQSGNVKAFETIRDTIGEKPTDKVAQDSTLEIRWQS